MPVVIGTAFVDEEMRSCVEELGNVEIVNKEKAFEELGARALTPATEQRLFPAVLHPV